MITSLGDLQDFMATLNNAKKKKKNSQSLFQSLSRLSIAPWLCGGDFNEILKTDEKRGGIPKNINFLCDFKDALQDCDVCDLGCQGYPFTWSNKRYGDGDVLIEERIDWFLCTRDWNDIFTGAVVSNIQAFESDHLPIVIDIFKRKMNLREKRAKWGKQFHYENYWR